MSDCTTCQNNKAKAGRKPAWLRVSYNAEEVTKVASLLDDMNLNTVCTEANCPNLGECYRKQTATFMVMGKDCTRNCRFCNVTCAKPEPLDPEEPERLAEAAAKLRLKHVVVTQVTRDDLADGGAAHMAATIRALKKALPESSIEVLVSDIKGKHSDIETVLEAGPDVLAHNVEMPKELYRSVRPQAIYERSLDVLDYAKKRKPDVLTKTGFMLGLGEDDAMIAELLEDLVKVRVDIVTIGQYLPPSPQHAPLQRYVSPDEFASYARLAEEQGIPFVVSTPLVRSSYRAAEALEALRGKEA